MLHPVLHHNPSSILRPGPRNAITDVPGILVGNAEDTRLLTGTTVVLPEQSVTAAADVRGGGPGTREIDALAPTATVQQAHAITLSGGSAFGLDAAGGVMDWLREEGRGFPVGPVRVPIVPSAILFDLLTGDGANWDEPPWWNLGRQAAAAASTDFALGNAGAGMGATAGALKGGLGTASIVSGDFVIGALSAVNPVGSTVIPGSRHFWAWALEQEGEFGGLGPPTAMPDTLDEMPGGAPATNTTLTVIATNAALTSSQAGRLAVMAHDGYARAIRPVHTPLDGDTVFVLATGEIPLADPIADITRLGTLGADCTARAIARGVFEAEAVAGIPAWRDLEAG
ncbi:P1 family peptidase [Rhodobacteraceae bacterium NNCM2]|nr:P1 family peptidase [Coraliihabitans acroporae]